MSYVFCSEVVKKVNSGTEYPRNYNNEHISFLSIDGMIEIIDVEGDEE